MANKSDAAQPTLSLPKGGGAIQGIGETFQPNLFTGTGNFTVPIATSPGRNGFGPQLSLQYSTGNGNGPFGLGWQLTIPRLTCKTEKGLPRYDAAAVFVLSGAEDLVPCLKREIDHATGEPRWTPEEPIIRGDYTVARYRPRTEGLFARIEKWVKTHGADAGDVHWRATSKDNVTSIYGKTPAARIVDPASRSDAAKRHRVYEWLLQETFDAKGNHILYEYAREDPKLSVGHIYEENRNHCQLYLRRIFYGNSHEPVGPSRRGTNHEDQLGEVERHYLFEVLFDYGDLQREGDPSVPPGEGQDLATATWPVRPDPFSNYRPGFEVRTSRRCERVLMFHHFRELGGPTLVKSTEFHYETNRDTLVSFLTAATLKGYRREGESYRSASMPPVTFEYSEFRPHEQRYQSIAARGNDLPPLALNNPDVALVDLFGKGLPDVLHTTPTGFRYWKNLGNGVLDRPRLMPRAPVGVTLSQPGVAFADMAGDGRADLLVLAEPVQGFYETTADGTWETFKPIPSLPSFRLSDPDVRLVDLTGDGLTDVLMTRDHHFLWWECRGEDGYAAPRVVERVHDLAEFPDVFFDDPSGRVRLADMNGDGLNDIVLIHNGRVDYWPNLGYGRFGKRVTMAQAPRLGHNFDPARLFFADLDGSGCADLVYVDFDRVHLWFNRSGNSWSEAQVIYGTPPVTNATAVQFGDIFGTGTTSVVWSYDFDQQPKGNYKVLDFCGGVKPYLLVEMSNNLGATTRVRYAASTKYALEDEANGQPWITRLPFPVQVVDKVEVIDHISKTKLVTSYKYHHGYFDGREREFRGFGRVDQFDTEAFESFRRADLHPGEDLFDNNHEPHHVPPVETRTWFHTGIYYDQDRPSSAGTLFDYKELTREYRKEFYQQDDEAFRPGEHDVETGDTPHEAYRALRGAVLRTEVYGRDSTERDEHPYVVTETRYEVRQLQPKHGNSHAVYLSTQKESLTYHYERNPNDPRIGHQVTLEVDDFGNVLQSVAIGYGRRRDDPDLLLTDDDRKKQKHTLITYTENRYTNPIQQEDAYRAPLLCETRTYELLNVAPDASGSRATSLLSVEEVLRNLQVAGDGQHDIPYEDVDATGAQKGDPCRRLIEHIRTLYRRDDLAGPLPLGQVQPLALPFESYKLAFTPGLVAGVYGGRITDAMLRNNGRYVHSEGDVNWWIPAGQVFYSPDSDDTFPQELACARQHFFLPHRFRDPFEQTMTVTYDSYDLLVQETRDALGNRVTAGERDPAGTLMTQGNDYRVRQPRLVMDPNRNRSAVAFDTLGLVVGTAVMGKPEESLGDSLDGFAPDLGDAAIAAHLQDPLADPHSILQRATTRLVYDLFAYRRTQGDPHPQPAVVSTLARETHDADLAAGQQSQIQQSFSYSDGFGREIQKKVQAEPGPLVEGGPEVSPCWVGSGWTIFNNKGQPIQQYEPFFSATHRFEFARTIGVSSVLFYDPVERVVATLHPNHTYEKVIFDPWRQTTWDVNDTVLQGDPKNDLEVGGFFCRLPEGTYLPTWYAPRQSGAMGAQEQAAATKAAVHANTPTIAYFDALGRPFLTVAHNRFERNSATLEEKYATRVHLDIEDNEREVIDTQDRLAMRYDYDMLGNKIHQASMEAGERWSLNDVTGRRLHHWDSRGRTLRTAYDALRRPSEVFLGEGAGPELLVERTVYGESQASPEASNLRAKVYQVCDGAGVVTSEVYDFKGNLWRSGRQLALEYKRTLDWSGAVVLETTTYTNHTTYDALNRPVALTTPDHSVIRLSYNEANLLKRIEASLRGAATLTALVNDIGHNAKGQRTLIAYGNGVRTQYAYDPQTFRLTHLLTTRGAAFPEDCPHPPHPPCGVQNLRYTYDPAGNILHNRDDAQQTVYFRNRQVEPSAEYTYDALYRLIEATGREHLGQANGATVPPTPLSPTDAPHTGLLHPGDGNTMGRYRQQYVYDAVGNILAMIHHGTDPAHPGWTRIYSYNEPSLLEPAKSSNRLTSTSIGSSTQEMYAYDAHGNMTTMPHLPLMQWDCQDQLQATAQQVVNDGGTPEISYYVYDAGGQRVRKVTERQAAAGQTPTHRAEHIYLGGFELYREYDGDGSVVALERETLHVMDGQQRIALIETRTQGHDGSPAQLIRYQLSNHLGSACLELDDAARVISYEEYYPYGSTSYQAVRSQIETPKRYRYTGKERDEESGLYYHGARYYAPWLSRWISTDPAALVDGVNMFQFSRQNPLLYVDRKGTQAEKVLALGLFTERQIEVGGRQVPILDPWQGVRAAAQQSLPGAHVIDLRDMPSHGGVWNWLGDANAPPGKYSGIASALVVQEALEGKGASAIHFDVRGVDALRRGSHSGSELGSVLANIAGGKTKIDIHILSEEGLSTIRKGTSVVEGAPLPKSLMKHLPPSFRSGSGGTGPAGGAGASASSVPRASAVGKLAAGLGRTLSTLGKGTASVGRAVGATVKQTVKSMLPGAELYDHAKLVGGGSAALGLRLMMTAAVHSAKVAASSAAAVGGKAVGLLTAEVAAGAAATAAVTTAAVVAAAGAVTWAVEDTRRALRGEKTMTDEALEVWGQKGFVGGMREFGHQLGSVFD
jgi:RHS repeat-associated protein